MKEHSRKLEGSAAKLFSVETLLLCGVGLLINLALAKAVIFLGLPLYIDNVGSVLVGALAGALPGMAVGFLTNLLNSFSDPITMYYGILTIIMAAMAAEYARRGMLRRFRGCMIAAASFVCVGGGVGSWMTWALYGGEIGGLAGPLATQIHLLGIPPFWSQLAADLVVDIPDKVITMTLVYLALRFYPKKLYDTFPLSHLYDRDRGTGQRETDGFYRVASVRTRMVWMIVLCAVLIAAASMLVSYLTYRPALQEPFAALTYLIRLASVLFAIVLLVAGAAIWYASCYITEPIARIVRQAKEFQNMPPEQWLESRHWQEREDITSGDEIEFLYKTVCLEQETVAKTVTELRRTEVQLRHSKELEKKNQELALAIEQADRANAAKGEFLSRMSHDMRTPINGILGLTSLMKRQNLSPGTRLDVDRLEMSGQYLLNLINDILDVSAIERGTMDLHPGVCSGRTMLENVLGLVQPEMDGKNLHFFVHAETVSEVPLYVDAGRVEQVVVSILSNAMKFTPEGGQIDFTMEKVDCDADTVVDRFVVRDSGIGMSESFLPHVFEPFSQEHMGSTSRYQGTGLGMTIAKKIVGLMGGDIHVESLPQSGTTVTFTLRMPKATAAQIAAADREKTTRSLQQLEGLQVLLCEDHPLNAQITTRLLREKGVGVDWAKDGREGLQKVTAGGSYDAVLMDIRMPEMDGLAATRAIRALDIPEAKTLPIIAMSANAFPEDQAESKAAGMQAHLAKPVEPQTLFETLLTYCQKRREDSEKIG